jgi:hypothetical protein
MKDGFKVPSIAELEDFLMELARSEHMGDVGRALIRNPFDLKADWDPEDGEFVVFEFEEEQ